MQTIQKRSIIKDSYLPIAVLDCIGLSVVSYILFEALGWISLCMIIPIFIYKVSRSVFLSLFRSALILHFNQEVSATEKLARLIIKTQEMAETSGRNLYKRRLRLLIKALENRFKGFEHLEKAMDNLISVNPKCVEKTGDLLREAEKLFLKKIFLEKEEIREIM